MAAGGSDQHAVIPSPLRFGVSVRCSSWAIAGCPPAGVEVQFSQETKLCGFRSVTKKPGECTREVGIG
jgi:hypothetical protein